MSDYATYLKTGPKYQPIASAETCDKLPPGIYTVSYDARSERSIFEEMRTTHDGLVDLPGTAYDAVLSDLEFFLGSECSDRFRHVDLLKKMNILLYGAPGGGKTCIVNRVAARMVAAGGIVLFNPSPVNLPHFFKVLDKLQPGTPVLVIFEELDQLIKDYNEGAFLHILDGETQKANAMFIATTNYISKVPARVRRPGRFAIRMEVGLPNLVAREFYCRTKLANASLTDAKALSGQIAEMTEGFNIDQLKDVIRAHYCMRKDLKAVVADLREEFQITSSGAQQVDPPNADEDWDKENEGIAELAKSI